MILKDEKKHHGAVDKSSSEQQFCNRTRLPLLCEKSGAILLVLMGFTTGRRQSDEIPINFEIFKILYRSHR